MLKLLLIAFLVVTSVYTILLFVASHPLVVTAQLQEPAPCSALLNSKSLSRDGELNHAGAIVVLRQETLLEWFNATNNANARFGNKLAAMVMPPGWHPK